MKRYVYDLLAGESILDVEAVPLWGCEDCERLTIEDIDEAIEFELEDCDPLPNTVEIWGYQPRTATLDAKCEPVCVVEVRDVRGWVAKHRPDWLEGEVADA